MSRSSASGSWMPPPRCSTIGSERWRRPLLNSERRHRWRCSYRRSASPRAGSMTPLRRCPAGNGSRERERMRSQPCLHERFRDVAQTFPERIAMSAGDEQVRYADLAERAESVAATLAERGVRPGDRVGLCCARGVPLIAGMLGILMAGGPSVPIDPGSPDTRIALLVQDSGVRVVLADDAGRVALPQTDAEVVDLAAAAVARARPGRPAVAADPDRIAHVIYTSGSTGVP